MDFEEIKAMHKTKIKREAEKEIEKEKNRKYIGYIKLHRDIQSTDLWKEENGNLLKVYIFCMLNANFMEGSIEKRFVKGTNGVGHAQLTTGRDKTSIRCNLSEGTFNTCLHRLEALGYIKRDRNPGNSVITVNRLCKPFTTKMEEQKGD